MQSPLFLFPLFIVGLWIGQLLNKVIRQAPLDKPILAPTKCSGCNTPVVWPETIPFVGYFYSKGRCLNCQMPVHWQYPLIDLLTGFIFAGMWLIAKGDISTYLILTTLTCALLVITVIDINHMLILDKILIAMTPVVWLIVTYHGYTSNSLPTSLKHALLGSFIGSMILLAMYFLSGGGMGLGDVKFMLVFGALVGGGGGVFYVFLIAGTLGVLHWLITQYDKNQPIPFGPALAAGILLTYMVQQSHIDIYQIIQRW